MNGGVVFVCDDFPERSGGKKRTPKALGGSSVTVHLNCADVQKAWKTAVKAGATVLLPLAKQFWGDVYGILADPFGQRWSMSAAHTDKPDVESSEYQSGAEEMFPTRAKPKRGAKKAKRRGK
jgi:PhnB protein